MTPSELLSHSRMACAKRCLQQHHYRYVLGLACSDEGEPRRMGTSFHAGRELMDNGVPCDHACAVLDERYTARITLADDAEVAASLNVEREKVARMLIGHAKRWQDEDYEVIAAELTFDLPIRNPATGQPSRLHRLAGKIDRIVRLPDGRVALQEYKTVGMDIAPGSDYWKARRLDTQPLIYVLAARELGHDVSAVLYDAVRRPTIRPKKIDKKMAAALIEAGHAADAVPERETPELYRDRLAADMDERPEFYFQRIEMGKTDDELDHLREELWQIHEWIATATRSGHAYRNTAACLMPGRCDYLDICPTAPKRDGNPPAGFRWLESVRPELEEPVT